MNHADPNRTSRRAFIRKSGRLAAASALAGVTLPHVHAASNNTIQVALVGCGGRGSGAAANALSTKGGPITLSAMADVFEDKLNGSYSGLKEKFGDLVDVPNDKKFIGFDGYKHAIDTLKPGDVAIFATPPAFRWVHFAYAIQKGVNVFMEKPVTTDGPASRRMLQLAEQSRQRGLKVGVGLMVRHCRARQEMLKRIQDGEIGDIITMRAYRMHGPVASAFTGPKNSDPIWAKMTELQFQIRRFHSFLWASGGCYNDFYIHQIDETSWMKGSWPVKAQASGGRQYRGDFIDQNFDNYSVEYTYADGAKLFFFGRTMNGCHDQMDSYVHGSKGVAIVSTSGHHPGKCRTFKGQQVRSEAMLWRAPQPEADPYQLEWQDLLEAIREDKPYNEVKRGVEASLTSSMGRMAAHTGQEITFEEMLNCEHEFAPGLDKLTADSPAPVQADEHGKYPVPMPGIKKDREY
jgi:predicted dehydrogenase